MIPSRDSNIIGVKKLNSLKLILLMLCVVQLSCGPKSSGLIGESTRFGPQHTSIPAGADLRKLYDQIYKRNKIEPCDEDNLEKIQIIIQALSEKQEDINAYGAGHPAPDEKNVLIGPTYFTINKDPPALSKKWEGEDSSWKETYDDYLKIAGTPVDNSWVGLDTDVKSLLDDDYFRLVNKLNFAISPFNVDLLRGTNQQIQKCLSTPGCLHPSFNNELLKFIDSIPDYLELYKSGDLNSFASRVKSDYDRHAFNIQPWVSRISKNEIQVKLDPGVYETATAEISMLLSKVWKTLDLTVTVNWMKRSPNDFFFMIQAGTTQNTRPYCSSDHTMNFFPRNGITSFAHEFGHVLGFPDHYYTTWVPKSCKYITYSNNSDIMSDDDGVTGATTPKEWRQLNEAYPF